MTAYSLPIMDTVKTAWAKVSGAKGAIWATFGIFFVIQLALGFCANLALPTLFQLISWIVEFLASTSLLYLSIKRAQDAPIRFGMIKEALTFNTVVSLIGVYFLQVIVLIPAIIVAAAGVVLSSMQNNASSTLHLVGTLLYLVAGILFIALTLRMYLGFGFVIDKKLNPLQALKASFKATKGNIWKLLGLFVIDFLIAIVCVITLGIGFIWGLPWLLIIYGETYKRLTANAIN